MKSIIMIVTMLDTSEHEIEVTYDNAKDICTDFNALRHKLYPTINNDIINLDHIIKAVMKVY